MAAAIKEAHPDAEVTLIAGGKGVFIVIGDGRQLWNKYETQRFPEIHELLAMLPPQQTRD